MSVLMIYRILGKGFGDAEASKLQFFVKNKMALSSILRIERVREKRLPVYYWPFQALPAFVQEKPSSSWPGLSAIFHFLVLATRNCNSQLATRNSQLATRNSQLATRNSQLATRNSQLATRNSQLATRNSTTRKLPSPFTNILQSFRLDKCSWRN